MPRFLLFSYFTVKESLLIALPETLSIKAASNSFFVNVTALLGLLVPIAFMHVFDTSLEILPHNYLRLRSHLKRIENELI